MINPSRLCRSRGWQGMEEDSSMIMALTYFQMGMALECYPARGAGERYWEVYLCHGATFKAWSKRRVPTRTTMCLDTSHDFDWAFPLIQYLREFAPPEEHHFFNNEEDEF